MRRGKGVFHCISILKIEAKTITNTVRLASPTGKTPLRGWAWLTSIQPWMAMVSCGKFYKVDSLAVATRISHNYQVLLA